MILIIFIMCLFVFCLIKLAIKESKMLVYLAGSIVIGFSILLAILPVFQKEYIIIETPLYIQNVTELSIEEYKDICISEKDYSYVLEYKYPLKWYDYILNYPKEEYKILYLQ